MTDHAERAREWLRELHKYETCGLPPDYEWRPLESLTALLASVAAPPAAEEPCETCRGDEEIDQRIGGHSHAAVVPCPDCKPPSSGGAGEVEEDAAYFKHLLACIGAANVHQAKKMIRRDRQEVERLKRERDDLYEKALSVLCPVHDLGKEGDACGCSDIQKEVERLKRERDEWKLHADRREETINRLHEENAALREALDLFVYDPHRKLWEVFEQDVLAEENPAVRALFDRALGGEVPDVRREVVDAAVALCDRLANEKFPKPTFAKLDPLFKAVSKHNRALGGEAPDAE